MLHESRFGQNAGVSAGVRQREDPKLLILGWFCECSQQN